MADDLKKQLTDLWGGFRRKAAETVSNTEANYALGKVAAAAVKDDDGSVIVEAGHRIDERVIEHAKAVGKLHALAAAVAKAGAQDLREKARQAYHTTEDGREARALDQVDDFVQARGYIGWTAGVDITTSKAEIVIPAGKEILESDVQGARDFGLLQALIYSAQQPLAHQPQGAEAGRTGAPPRGYVPLRHEPPKVRAPLPVVTLPDLSKDTKDDA